MVQQYLLASDFDQTLSFNDSGVVLSELIGFHSFDQKVKALSNINLVQQGAELSYLILHDPDFRRVRREHLIETGKRIRLKHDVKLFARLMEGVVCKAFIGDKAFDSRQLHDFLAQHGIEAVIPPRKGTMGRDDYDREKYKWRHLIENFFCRIKAFRRIATRYEKTDNCFAAMIHAVNIAIVPI